MRVRDPDTDPDVLRARLEDHTRIRDAEWQRMVAARIQAEARSEPLADADTDVAGAEESTCPAGLEERLPESAAPPELPTPGRHASRRATMASWRSLRSSVGDRVGSPVPSLSRIGFSPAQVAVVAVLAAIVLAIATWWVLRSQASEQATPAVSVSTAASGAPLTTGAPTPDPAAGSAGVGPAGAVPADQPDATGSTGELVVHVDGQVQRPGVVVLPAGARVADAIEAAGGALPDTELAGVNLARPLVDGEQVLVGIDPPPGSAAAPNPVAGAPGAPASPAAGGLVSLNSADLAGLDTLPGVGPVTAQSIIDWRTANGGFSSVEELIEVDGIGEATLARIAPHVTL